MVRVLAAGLALAALVVGPGARANDRVKIGMIVTLSGPSAVIGQQSRDGFMLALKDLGGKLGGLPADVVVIDDELKPDVAVTRIKGLADKGDLDFVVGPIFSNILMAIVKPTTDAKAFLISPNSGPSVLAGKNCNPFFFATSYQNDQPHQVLGKVAQERNYKKVYLLAPNYQAGKDAVAGFKTDYRGEVLSESYVPLNTLDFQSEIANIASMKPDAIYVFLPGGMGVSFVRQFRQAGLAASIPVLSAYTVDEATLPAHGDAAAGMYGGANWTPDLDTPQNKRFVAGFEAAYKVIPANYAFQAYDAALLINGAVGDLKGDLSDKTKIRAALMKADFTSLRGKFAFNNNGFPIQDFYLYQVEKRPDGKYQTSVREKVLSDHGDAYAKDCALKKS